MTPAKRISINNLGGQAPDYAGRGNKLEVSKRQSAMTTFSRSITVKEK